MKFFPKQCLRAKSARQSAQYALIFGLIFCLWSPQTWSQSALNALENGLNWSVSQNTQNGADELELQIQLGDPVLPLSQVTGFDLYFQLHGDVTLPAWGDLDFSNSGWLSDPSLELELILDPSDKRLRLVGSFAQSQSSHGEVLRIHLPNSGTGLQAQQAVIDGGGLILVEDIGFKKPFATEISLAPNPSKGLASLNLGKETALDMLLINPQGKVVQHLTGPIQGNISLDLQGQAPGIYRIVLTCADHRTQVLNCQILR